MVSISDTTINHLTRSGETMQRILSDDGTYYPIEIINTALLIWFEQYIEEIAEDSASIITSERLNRQKFNQFLKAEVANILEEVEERLKNPVQPIAA